MRPLEQFLRTITFGIMIRGILGSRRYEPAALLLRLGDNRRLRRKLQIVITHIFLPQP
jgi:hypothetical protein